MRKPFVALSLVERQEVSRGLRAACATCNPATVVFPLTTAQRGHGGAPRGNTNALGLRACDHGEANRKPQKNGSSSYCVVCRRNTNRENQRRYRRVRKAG